jgi:hypothetical protein
MFKVRAVALAAFAAIAATVARAQIQTVVEATANTGGPGATPLTPRITTADGSAYEVAVVSANPRGETSLTLDAGFGVRYVAPSRVTVPSGERLTVGAPAMEGMHYIWVKNGVALPQATSNVLTLDHVTTADAGTYALLYSTPTTLPRSSQLLLLGVGPNTRLTNISMRGALRDGPGQSFVAGFAVSAGAEHKKVLIRAIGPSLALFDVDRPLAKPVLRIYDSQNRPYTNGFVYPAVVGGGNYESDLADALSRTGAFPTLPGSADVVLLMPFPSGTFTAQVSSADAIGGEVLIEIYEVP